MAWDTEKTKRLLLDAATQEFSQYGLAGARVDRIAKAAGVNKERLYQYFGNKSALFGAVLSQQLLLVVEAVSITGQGADAIADYAGQVFDYHRQHPKFARLQLWEGLELTQPVAFAERAEAEHHKIAALQRALPGCDAQSARELLLSIISLVCSWRNLHTLDRLLGSDHDSELRLQQRRAAIVEGARVLAQQYIPEYP